MSFKVSAHAERGPYRELFKPADASIETKRKPLGNRRIGVDRSALRARSPSKNSRWRTGLRPNQCVSCSSEGPVRRTVHHQCRLTSQHHGAEKRR